MKEIEKELQKWVDEETLRERQESKGERLTIVEVNVRIHHEKNVTQGEECDRKIETIFIEENEKDEKSITWSYNDGWSYSQVVMALQNKKILQHIICKYGKWYQIYEWVITIFVLV